jgi:hypothetical protein
MSAAGKLARALTAMADAVGQAVCVAIIGERPWASATFVGARHVLALDGDSSAGFAAWVDTLADAEFAVPGHLVVDVSVERSTGGVRLSALMLVAA